MKKQETAVEWLIDWMKKNEYFIGNNLLQAFLQAKVIERDQMEHAYFSGSHDNFNDEGDFKKYYNETYKELEQ